MALRLANADVLPFDYATYGRDLLAYLDDVESAGPRSGRWPLDLAAARAAADALAAVGAARPARGPRTPGRGATAA